MRNYNTLAKKQLVIKTAQALEAKGYKVFMVDKRKNALDTIKDIIPSGASVMNGSSVTLQSIGFLDYLKSNRHNWVNLHAKITAENNPAKRLNLRKRGAFSDYYLGSAHALLENGEFIIASNSGSQLPHIVYTSSNLIFVVSTKKIVSDLAVGFQRLEEYVIPLENKRMHDLYGMGTKSNKILIFKGEKQKSGRKITFILVNENLGF